MAKKKAKKSKKKPLPKFKYVWIDILGGNIYWIHCSRTEYEKRVRLEFEVEPPKYGKETQANFSVYHKGETPIGVIWFRKKTIPILAHECFHATHWICHKQGIWLTDSSEEVYAYILEYLIKKLGERNDA